MMQTAGAQKKQQVTFSSYNSAGFVAGKLPVAFAAQTENGIAFKNWFIGAGFGIDDYYLKTLPLFGAVKKIIPLKNNAFFLYANVGSNLIAKNKTQKTNWSTIYTKSGFYADAGVGYLIKTGRKSHLFFSAGNTVKKMEEVEQYPDSYGMTGFNDTVRKFSRISFKLGFQF